MRKYAKIGQNRPKVAPFFIVKDFDKKNVIFMFYMLFRTCVQKSGDGPFFFYFWRILATVILDRVVGGASTTTVQSPPHQTGLLDFYLGT